MASRSGTTSATPSHTAAKFQVGTAEIYDLVLRAVSATIAEDLAVGRYRRAGGTRVGDATTKGTSQTHASVVGLAALAAHDALWTAAEAYGIEFRHPGPRAEQPQTA